MKTKIATAITLALLAGTTYAAPTFYGEIDLSVDYVAAENKNDVEDRDITDINSNNSYLGLKGEEKLTERLSALYQAEFTFYADDGDNNGDAFVPRNILLGLKDEKLGTLKIGKIDTPLKQLSLAVDSFNNSVDNSADIHGIMGGENRIDNTLVYEAPAIKVGSGKVDIKAQVATGEGENQLKQSKGGYTVAGRGLGDSWSSSVTYTDKTVIAGLAYDKAIPTRFLSRGFLNADKPEVTADRNVLAEANTIRAIGRLNLLEGDLALKALYQTSEVENPLASPTDQQTKAAKIDDAQAWLIGAEYKLPTTSDKWTLKGQFSQNITTFKDASEDYEANQFLVGLDYALSKQVKVYGHAGYLTIEQGSDEDEQVLVGTGFEFRF